MTEPSGLKEPENWYWHVALVFTLAVGYALITGAEIMLGAMMGTGMTARYLWLALTGILFGLLSGLILSRQCISTTQMYAATRNVSFFPACFVAWLATTITGMQAAARSFAESNAISFHDPFGAMVNPIAAGAITLLIFDACATIFILRMAGAKINLLKYESLVVITYLAFAYALKLI